METKELPILQEMVVLNEEQQKEVAKNGYECPDCTGTGKVYYTLGSGGMLNTEYTCGRCGGLGKVITRRAEIRRIASQVEYLYLPTSITSSTLSNLFAIDGVVRVERRKRVQRNIDLN